MLHYLLFVLCVLCQQRLHGHNAYLQLCEYCLADLPWNSSPCSQPPLTHQLITAHLTPLLYQGAPANWVRKAKHHSGLIQARVLGTLLAEAVLEQYLEPRRRPDVIVPVPLSLRRLLSRGHNQADLIAMPVARALSIPIARRLVVRTRHTPIQPGLHPRQRVQNVAGAFRMKGSVGARVIAIVDDVLTTGATVTALANCLARSGATEIHVWCPTRTQATATLPPTLQTMDTTTLGDQRNTL